MSEELLKIADGLLEMCIRDSSGADTRVRSI